MCGGAGWYDVGVGFGPSTLDRVGFRRVERVLGRCGVVCGLGWGGVVIWLGWVGVWVKCSNPGYLPGLSGSGSGGAGFCTASTTTTT